jgi:large subunit ribosomal protein L13
MPKAADISRKWYMLDAAGQPMGKVAAQAATLLRGKHKPLFAPHVDCGDFVIIVNAEKAVLTGSKLQAKYYRTHSGYAGGLKEVQYKKLMSERPQLAMKLAVKGMLPKNSIGRASLVRVKIYAGPEHKQEAQKPTLWAGQ